MSMQVLAQEKSDSTSSGSTPRRGVLQRKCACGGSAGPSGECSACGRKRLNGGRLQTKLRIGAVDDPLELEADRVAAQVMAASDNAITGKASLRIQRLSAQPTGQTEPAPVSVDNVLASSGRPMELALRQDMEQRFSYNFSHVRVHTDTAAEQSAKDVGAHAYTVGHDIAFGSNRFVPGTHEGRQLIAHELTHVIQQADSVHSLMRTCDCAQIGARQPNSSDPAEAGVSSAFPGLVSGDWCVLAPPTTTYNCYAWSVSDTSQWIDSQVDHVYGDNNGNLSFSDFDSFYSSTLGLLPTTNPDSNTVVALFAKGLSPTHAALVADISSCGDIPFTSKLGMGPLIAHDLYQLEGSTYGKVSRYYGT